MNDQQLGNHVARLVRSAKDHLDKQAPERERAMEYYNGVMKDFPANKGRSSVTSDDLRATFKKVVPSIMRALLSGSQMVEYQPVGPGDEVEAEQATKYVNSIVVEESNVEAAIYDAVFDAAIVKTGILKWAAYETRKVIVQDYTDQSDDALLGLTDDPANEIIDHEKTEETDPAVLELNPNARRHTFKLKRVDVSTDVRVDAVPRGSFLISPDADNIEDAELCGEILIEPRSKLVSWGYDRDLVDKIETHEDAPEDDESLKGEDSDDGVGQRESRKAMETVMVYEVYVRIDTDDDGIAELWRVVYGKGESDSKGDDGARHVILGKEIVSEAPFTEVVIERDPHQFEGHSLFEDTEQTQRVKTALLRSALNNLYASTQPRPAVNTSYLSDGEELSDWNFGQPINFTDIDDVRKAIQWETVPYVADKAFAAMEYMDTINQDRTGVTDASGGVDPEQFQNTSATAAQLMSESGVAQADAIVRSIAVGVGRMFRGLLKLVIAHSDQPRSVRIGKEWVDYDPSTWNVDMKCDVNVGLGGGTKERDLAVLQIVLGLQREIMMSLGADNPLVKPDQLHNTLDKITEAAGFVSSEPYFTKPDPEEIARKQQEAASRPDPEKVKLDAQMQLEQMKMKANRDKEMAQLEADMQVKNAELEKESIGRRETLEADRIKASDELAFKREQMQQESAIKFAEIEAKLKIASMPKEPANAEN